MDKPALSAEAVVNPETVHQSAGRVKAEPSRSLLPWHRRALIRFPWQAWAGLGLLLLLFTSIGAIWFWAVLSDNIPHWIPLLMTMLWVLAGGGLLVLLYWMWQEFNRFGADLSSWAAGLRQGDLSVRMPIREPVCLSQTTREQINAITDEYEKLSRFQQQRFDRQEKFIAEKKRQLNVLYEVASGVNRADNLEALLQHFMETLRDVVDARAVAVRLVGPRGNLRLVASLGLDESVQQREEIVPDKLCACFRAFSGGDINGHNNMLPCEMIIDHPFFADEHEVQMLAIPLSYRDKTLGIYNLYVPQDKASQLEDEYELLMSIGQHLGMAIEKANVDEEAHTLSIMEERTRMAHELHDSLAQTLASLRFKVRLFDDSMNSGNDELIWQELEGLENTIDDAYAELRSLITHFRAPLDGKGVLRAVENMAERFRVDTGLDVFFYHNWNLQDLSSEAELEVVRIVQEALNNIRKHSQAETVRILMYSSEEGRCSILVEDDGVGLPDELPGPDPVTGEHLGMQIMHDRAEKLNGELQFESDPEEQGTLMQLSFDVPRTRKLSEMVK